MTRRIDDIVAHSLFAQDPYAASDACGEIFETWYSEARSFAAGKLDAAAMAAVSSAALNSLQRRAVAPVSTEFEVAAFSALDNLDKLSRVFRTKPKFTTLLETPGSELLVHLQKALVPALLAGIAAASCSSSVRARLARSLRGYVELFASLASAHARFGSLMHGLDLRPVVQIALRPSSDPVLRDEACSCLKAATTPYTASAIAATLAAGAMDMTAFALAWSTGLLQDERCVRVLQARLQRLPGDGALTSVAINAMLSTLRDHFTTCAAATTSAAAGAPRAPELQGGVLFDPSTQSEAVVRLVRAAEAALLSAEAGAADTAERARSDHVLDLAGALLQLAPTCGSALNLALYPLCAEGVATVAGVCAAFPERAWLHDLLPFVTAQLERMSLAGVSGDQLHQEVITLLRDCARLHYLNYDRHPSAELGAQLFRAMVEAIRHGYIETERFPELCARVVLAHADGIAPPASGMTAAGAPAAAPGLDPANWLAAAFDDSVCHNHKTTRAVSEMLQQLLGLASSSFGAEISSERRLSDAARERVLMALAEQRSRAVDAFWTELAVYHGPFVMANERAIAALLQRAQVDDMVQRGDQPGTLRRLSALLRTVALRVTARNAALLFDAVLKVMALSPATERVITDDALACVVQRMLPTTPLQRRALDFALVHAGPATRLALAALLPTECLRDPSPAVRAAAMRALAARPALLPQAGSLVLAAWVPGATARVAPSAEDLRSGSDVAEAEDVQLLIHELELADAATPLLADLAVRRPELLSQCMPRLAVAASLSAANDAQNVPSKHMVAALDRVAREANFHQLATFARSQSGRACLPKLASASPAWRSFLHSLVRLNVIAEAAMTQPPRARAASASAVQAATTTSETGDATWAPSGRFALLRRALARSTAQYASVAATDESLQAEEASEPVGVDVEPLLADADAYVALPGGAGAEEVSARVASMEAEGAEEALAHLRSLQEAGAWVDAVYQACAIRTRFPAAFVAHNLAEALEKQLLPLAVQAAVPQPAGWDATGLAVFHDRDLDRVEAAAAALTALLRACPEEAQRCVHAESLLGGLQAGYAQRVLRERGPAAARAWLQEHSVRLPQAWVGVASAEAVLAASAPPLPVELWEEAGMVPAPAAPGGAPHAAARPPPAYEEAMAAWRRGHAGAAAADPAASAYLAIQQEKLPQRKAEEGRVAEPAAAYHAVVGAPVLLAPTSEHVPAAIAVPVTVTDDSPTWRALSEGGRTVAPTVAHSLEAGDRESGARRSRQAQRVAVPM